MVASSVATVIALLMLSAPVLALADACYANVPCPDAKAVCAAYYETDLQEPFIPDVSECQCKPGNTTILKQWSIGNDGWLKCEKAKPTPRPCPPPALKDTGGNCVCPACDSPQQPVGDRCKPDECISEGPYSDPPCHCYLKPQPPDPTPKPGCYTDVPCPATGAVCAAYWQTDPMDIFIPDVSECQCMPGDTKLLPEWTVWNDGYLKCQDMKPTPRPCPSPASVDTSGKCTCPSCDSPQQPAYDRCKPNECNSEGPYSDPPCHCYLKNIVV